MSCFSSNWNRQKRASQVKTEACFTRQERRTWQRRRRNCLRKISPVRGSAGSRLVLVREGINLNNWWSRRASKISLTEKPSFISQQITIQYKLVILWGESCVCTLVCSNIRIILLLAMDTYHQCVAPFCSLLEVDQSTARVQQRSFSPLLSMFRFYNDPSVAALLARGCESARGRGGERTGRIVSGKNTLIRESERM